MSQLQPVIDHIQRKLLRVCSIPIATNCVFHRNKYMLFTKLEPVRIKDPCRSV